MKRAWTTRRGMTRGFTLIEILVALVVFAAMAAITWGALGQIARARASLAIEQERFAAVVRCMSDLERDLRQAISRPLRGNYGEPQPALLGSGERIELSRLGYANPLAEPRSNIERVLYAIDDKRLRRGRYAVLDRAAGSVPQWRELADRVSGWRLRYLDAEGNWSDQWPPRGVAAEVLPRAVEFRLVLEDFGELRRVLALPSTLQVKGVGSSGTVSPDTPGIVPQPVRAAIGVPPGATP